MFLCLFFLSITGKITKITKITIEDSKTDNTDLLGRTEFSHQLAYVDH